jgi:hypothetical protein
LCVLAGSSAKRRDENKKDVPMACVGKQEVPPVAEVESLADFLVNLGKALRDKEGIDVDLADILAKHLLTAAPSVDAVAKAKAAILKLAAERASPPAPGVSDD